MRFTRCGHTYTMSDVYAPEVNPDNEPGELLQEALRGADADSNAEPDDEDADPDL